ncbi:MAG: sulfatase-like hydrolase/transferase, partial [Verrucomicrobiae bacterium]|nr:sulfatase-like hydrolase/transferase [Verrucomicrobiae bacterium]
MRHSLFLRLRPVIPVALTLGLLVSTIRPALAAASQAKPNILFIFADDLSHEMIHTMGNDRIITPNLDRLAESGMAFTHAYNMGSWSGAVCVASRTMLNTGRYIWHAHAVSNGKVLEQERQAGRFWSEQLKQAGYRTYMTGKWHVSVDAAKAFDVARHIRPGMPKQTPDGYNRPHPGQPDPWDPADPKFGGFWEGGKHWSEIVADDAIDYLQDARERQSPFFMYIAFNAPHDPRQSPQEFVDLYPPETMPVPADFLAKYPYEDDIGCGPGLRDEKLAPFPRTRYAVQVHRQEYHAITTHMDLQVGRILAALQASGKADNTWIFFTADHGLAVGHHGLMGKQNQYDDSVRVPFFVVGPGVPKGKRLDAAVYLQDIMPTTLELAGVAKPGHVEFQSVLPFVRGQRVESFYPAVYGGYLKLQRMVT